MKKIKRDVFLKLTLPSLILNIYKHFSVYKTFIRVEKLKGVCDFVDIKY